MFQVGDLVKIQSGYADPHGQEYDWVGMILSYRGKGNLGEEEEWVVQWAHTSDPAHEYGYYLEVI